MVPSGRGPQPDGGAGGVTRPAAMASAHTEPGASASDDIVRSLRAHAAVLASPESRAAYLAVVAEAARDDALRARFREEVLDPGRRLIVEGVARAHERGEVPDGIDVDVLHDLLAGPMVHRVLVRGGEADDAFVHALAGMLLLWAEAIAAGRVTPPAPPSG